MLETREGRAISCPDCGTEVAAHFLICPGCHRLVHSDALKRLADEAGAAGAAGDPTAALVAWRSALELLPAGTKQHEAIRARIEALGRAVDASPGPRKPKASGGAAGWAGGAGAAGLGTIGLALWKFKFLALMILGKGKLLLLGLTKASTLLSMFVSMGAYWTLWGWPFAVGLVLSIYVHEMGHVAALLRYGIKADAPMFIPGFGALIRARQVLSNPREEAQVGLGGPLWGTAGAGACFAVAYAAGIPMLAAIAKLAAAINLFNLIPVWQLDGSHAFRAFTRPQRWFAAVVISILWATGAEHQGTAGVFLLAMLVFAAYQAAFVAPPAEGDRVSLAEYVGLAVVLTLMTRIDSFLP